MVAQFDVSSLIEFYSAESRSAGYAGYSDTQLYGARSSTFLPFRQFGFARLLGFDVVLGCMAWNLSNVVFCAVDISSHDIFYVATQTDTSQDIVDCVSACAASGLCFIDCDCTRPIFD